MDIYDQDVKTSYVRNKIKESTFNDLDYIKALVKLENFVENPPSNFNSGMYFSMLKNKYNRDYLSIFKELDPNGFEDYLRKEDERKREYERWQKDLAKQKKEEYEKAKEWWVRNGGKL